MIDSVLPASAPDCVKTKIIGNGPITLNVVVVHTVGKTILIDGDDTNGYGATNLEGVCKVYQWSEFSG